MMVKYNQSETCNVM